MQEHDHQRRFTGLSRQEWLKSFIAYLPHVAFVIAGLIILWVLRINGAQVSQEKRVKDLEEKVHIQWRMSREVKEALHLAEVESNSHSRESDEAIINLKASCRDDRERIMRLESIHIKGN